MQIFGVGAARPRTGRRTCRVFSSHFLPDGQVTPAQRCGTQKPVDALVAGGAGELAAACTAGCTAPSRQPKPRRAHAAVSVMPSQSLSLPSQISGVGQHAALADEAHRAAADEVARLAGAARRSICAWVRPGQRQVVPVCGKLPLSMTPSQLSSMPLQISAWACPSRCRRAGRSCRRRCRTGRCRGRCRTSSPTPGSVPSSIWPLQLSSMPLQTSGCGVTGARRRTSPSRRRCRRGCRRGGRRPRRCCAGRADVEALVDVAVAVVVEAVADLGRDGAAARPGRRRWAAGPRRPARCSCRPGSCRSRPRSGGRRPSCAATLSGSVVLLGRS